MEKSLDVYISYAHEDEMVRKELEKHLMILRRSGAIRIWDDRKLKAGESWADEIKRERLRADIILLLVSDAFLASDFLSEELKDIMDRHFAGSAKVIPIIVRDCLWQITPIQNLQVLPKDGKPLSHHKDRDTVYTEIVREISRSAESFEKRPKWLQLIEEERTKRSGILDLRDLGLTSIPEEVEELTWLHTLNLESNRIRKIGGLEKLSQLKQLNLSFNEVDTIQGLNTLTELSTLDLSSNKISKIEGLSKLTKLLTLSLPYNQISKIEGLSMLRQLRALNLNFNAIGKIEGLSSLRYLTTLFLVSNKISSIEGMDSLTELSHITLSSNQITKIEGLDNLKSLTAIDLDSNKIERIQGINNLKSLNMLNLSSNKITKIEGLTDLKLLKTLNLTANEISSLDQLEVFPSSIEVLQLYGNHIKNINASVFGTSAGYNCLNDLRSYFAEQLDINVPEVKLILTGNSDVGKTKFRKYLTSGIYDTDRNSTHGLEVHPLVLDSVLKAEYGFPDNAKITIWDFGGQEYFHNTHQLFFSENAVYIFLWEKGTNKNQPIQTVVKNDAEGKNVYRVLEHFDANYWLSNIRHFAANADVILVQNKVDIYKETEPLQWLPYECLTQYGCKDQYHISISKSAENSRPHWYDFQKLKYVILSALKDFISENKEGNIYNEVRKKIETLSMVNYWKVEDFLLFIEELKTKSQNLNAKTIDNRLVVEHFNRQGKVLYPSGFPLDPGNVIFTDPQWLSGKIYEILNDAVLQRSGFFDEKDLMQLVADNKFDNEIILKQIVELMREYNIVFYNPNTKQYVAPQYLPEVPTVHFSQVKKLLSKPKLIIKANGFLPKSIINNVIATYAIKDDAASFYKYGVKTETPDGIILLIEIDYSQKKIYIYTDAPEPFFLRNVFEDILLKFEIKLNTTDGTTAANPAGASPANDTKLINVKNTDLSISIDDKVFVNWIKLWDNYRSPDIKIDRDYCLSEDGNLVLRKIFAPFYFHYSEVRSMKTTDEVKPKKMFISYSSKNTDFMRRFVTHLEPLKRSRIIDLWYDRMIEPGTKWDNSIKEEMDNTDVFIFLLSPDLLATNYIFEYEIPQAIKQMESGRSRLFFVALQECSWKKTVFSRFQQITDPLSTNKAVILIDSPMNDSKWQVVIDALENTLSNNSFAS